MSRSSALSSEPSAGIWSLDGGALSLLEHFDIGPAIVLVPTESVLLTMVDLPLPTRRARLDALPFALEDQVAGPISRVHIALGSELAPGRYLTGVIDPGLMERWTALLDEAGLDHAWLVPDALALPVPATGGWSLDVAGGRAMVRTDDGAGFALPAANLEAAWHVAGRPTVSSYGDAIPFVGATVDLDPVSLAQRLTNPALDLRQGAFAPARQTASPLLRRILVVAGLGLLAHGAIAAADTFALDHIARQRATETRALAEQVAPGRVIGDDVASSVVDLLPTDSGPSDFLPLVDKVTAALAPLGPGTTLADLSFDGAADTVTVDIDAPDSAGLQRVADALRTAGLDARAGASQIAPGKASGSFLVRRPQ